MPILVLDIETTGLCKQNKHREYYHPKKTKYYDNSRIIEVAYTIYAKNTNTNQWESIKDVSNLIKTDKFLIENTFIHGIEHDDAVNNGRPINEVFDLLQNDLSNINKIVAYNANFDINILLSEMYRYNNEDLINIINNKKILCGLKLARHKIKNSKNYKLINIYNFLHNTNEKQTHRALDDVNICAKVFFKLSSLDFSVNSIS